MAMKQYLSTIRLIWSNSSYKLLASVNLLKLRQKFKFSSLESNLQALWKKLSKSIMNLNYMR
uniref:Uncharacterized protein n=1 Tax=Romanomermis culicivorax TaxID=13658 RepID=A0A915K4E3_ROMCU